MKREGNWITAEGTTLGADNGIGVATSLAIATSEDLKHGSLEFLFTVDEETGLNGASSLQSDFLKGRKLINLDSESFGTFTIGCAGGGNSEILLPIETESHDKAKLVEVNISGLKGGHSGVDINEGRANSIKVLGRLLWKLNQKTKNLVLIYNLSGGSKHNVIPRESTATVAVIDSIERAEKVIQQEFDKVKGEYQNIEQNMKLSIERTSKEEGRIELFTSKSSKQAIGLMQALPHGVLAMAQENQNLVRTSANLATISEENGKLKITMSARSSIESELEATRDRIRAIGEILGAEVNENQPYPGWEPNTDSELLKVITKSFIETFNEEPKIEVIHAGLETGIIGEKYEDIDITPPILKFS